MTYFPAKLLLFGEHIVLKGASALAIPFDHFYGGWENRGTTDQQQELFGFLIYLKKLAASGELILRLDLESLEKDLEQGLYFRSDIPVGYGLGSSGALCAAVNARYGEPPSRQEMSPLQKGLAQMESFFHGSSSGTDPLISYLKVPMILSESKVYPPLWQDHTVELLGRFFLLDSRQPRDSAPMIKRFLLRMEDPDYAAEVNHTLLPATEKAIKSLLSADLISLQEHMRVISSFQLDRMSWMILPQVDSCWREGLEQDLFYLKVCGAGGGGFYLGLARNVQATRSFFEQKEQEVLWLGEE